MSNEAGILKAVLARGEELHYEHQRLLEEVKPVLIGRLVRWFELYEIVAVDKIETLGGRPAFRGWGVRVNRKTGRRGTRGYNITIEPKNLLPKE